MIAIPLHAATLPTPTDLDAADGAIWFFTIWASVFAAIILPWCITQACRRDPVPLLMWLGGAICSVSEPMADHLTHLWWAGNNLGPVFSGFDVDVPAFIPPAHIAAYGMLGYLVYRRLAAQPTVRDVFGIWLICVAADAVFEQPGVIPGVYEYYGDQPFEFYKYPLYNAWLNATASLLVGFLLLKTLPLLRGRAKAVIVLVPVSGMVCSWSVVAWPVFMALNWDMPDPLAWLLASLSLVLALLVVRGVAEFTVAGSTDQVASRDLQSRDVPLTIGSPHDVPSRIVGPGDRRSAAPGGNPR